MNGRPRLGLSQVVGVAAIVAIVGALVYPSVLRAVEEEPSLQDGVANLQRLHQAVVMYGEANDVWDELPGMGRVSETMMKGQFYALLPYVGDGSVAALRSVLYSPALPTWARKGLASSHTWQIPSWPARYTMRAGEVTPRFADRWEEFKALGEGYAYLTDGVFDEAFYYPRERDQSRGALNLELSLNGSVAVARRMYPRGTLEKVYATPVGRD